MHALESAIENVMTEWLALGLHLRPPVNLALECRRLSISMETIPESIKTLYSKTGGMEGSDYDDAPLTIYRWEKAVLLWRSAGFREFAFADYGIGIAELLLFQDKVFIHRKWEAAPVLFAESLEEFFTGFVKREWSELFPGAQKKTE